MKIVKLYLRLAVAVGFLSASADRLGFLPHETSAWGSWKPFLDYTATLNPWFPAEWIPTLGVLATVFEITFGIFLLIGFKTELIGKLSGVLLLIFAISMIFSIGVKQVLDYSVFAASAAGFAIGTLKLKYLEIDQLFSKKKGYRKRGR